MLGHAAKHAPQPLDRGVDLPERVQRAAVARAPRVGPAPPPRAAHAPEGRRLDQAAGARASPRARASLRSLRAVGPRTGREPALPQTVGRPADRAITLRRLLPVRRGASGAAARAPARRPRRGPGGVAGAASAGVLPAVRELPRA